MMYLDECNSPSNLSESKKISSLNAVVNIYIYANELVPCEALTHNHDRVLYLAGANPI